MQQEFSHVGFVRAYVIPALLLFALPLGAYAFSAHAIGSYDADFVQAVSASLADDPEVSEAGRAEVVRFVSCVPTASPRRPLRAARWRVRC